MRLHAPRGIEPRKRTRHLDTIERRCWCNKCGEVAEEKAQRNHSEEERQLSPNRLVSVDSETCLFTTSSQRQPVWYISHFLGFLAHFWWTVQEVEFRVSSIARSRGPEEGGGDIQGQEGPPAQSYRVFEV